MRKRKSAAGSTLARGVPLYIGFTCVAAVGGVAAGWVLVGPPTDFVALGTLLALGFISVWVKERDVGSRVPMSFLSIVVIAGVVLTGPVGSAVIGALPVLFERDVRGALARPFNASMLALQGVVGGLVYLWIGGAADIAAVQGPSALLLHVGVPLMVADVAQMLVNALLLSGIMRLSTGVPPRRFFAQIVTGSGVAYIAYGVIGFLLVILWVPADVGPFSAVLILAPLFVARWAFVQFGDEQRAHERTLSALVTAVETKDPYAAGHSARIAQLAEWMAEPLSMGAQDVQALRYAAMLHDVGKVGVPTRILRRPRALTPADLEALTHHPALGVVLVREIEFLSGSLAGIRHHHERWDGLGYPDSLAGDEIPLISRVIAVADAFDALTTDRTERPALAPPQALKQIEQRRGRQFDPQVVAALATVLERHEWPVTTSDEDSLELMRGYLDHDDPIAWERAWNTATPTRPSVPEPAREPAREVMAARSTGPEPMAADRAPRIPEERPVPEQVRAP
jgi:HD-GYP domain-containing protein (c-di-GMP phosphodiesterase class II)